MREPAVDVTFFIDPGCPFGYSAWPALAALQWRYGEQLRWRTVMIGLAETPEEYAAKDFDTVFMATSQLQFRAHGMPFAPAPKERLWGTSLACRTVIAVRREAPEWELHALRALQFAQFCTPLLLDDPRDLVDALRTVPAVDAEAAVAAAESPAVWDVYERERAEARSAEGGPAWAQGKTAGERYTAPSLILSRAGTFLEAGGFQPLAAYDVLVANLAPELHRREPPERVEDALAAFPFALTTAELRAIAGDDAEERLIVAAAAGTVSRVGIGDGALWSLTRRAADGRFGAPGRSSVRNVTSST